MRPMNGKLYLKYNFCSVCRLWFDKSQLVCPICKKRLRTRPVNKGKIKKMMTNDKNNPILSIQALLQRKR